MSLNPIFSNPFTPTIDQQGNPFCDFSVCNMIPSSTFFFNKLIHIGHPIDVDEDKLSYALYVLEHAAEHETDDMRLIVESVVPTYHPKL